MKDPLDSVTWYIIFLIIALGVFTYAVETVI